jgi:hypothetical protein
LPGVAFREARIIDADVDGASTAATAATAAAGTSGDE